MQAMIHNVMAAMSWIGIHLANHPMVCAFSALAVALVAISVHERRPPELTGNGIAVGQAKAFDNRSLALKVERLATNLDQIKIINQEATSNLQTFQERSTSESRGNLAFKANANLAKDAKPDPQTTPAPPAASPDLQAKLGLAAADVLSDQLNLASQIFNIQTLYERSLSDRLIGGRSRLQTVLGFQASINPPCGFEDCVAIIEVAVRFQPKAAGQDPIPVSLVALLPQEKTYNVESLSSTERSIDGSAVTKVVTLAAAGKQSAKQLFLHRDSDTIAFERTAGTIINSFDNATVFGWEFRPVLGRRAVSAGTRQLLAVISLPQPDGDLPTGADVQILTRTFWRRYNRSAQTSAPAWSWIPWRVDRSETRTSRVQALTIPNTAGIQSYLAPVVSKIEWVSTGNKQATVIVSGSNFFTGTKVVVGGVVHSAETNNLTLKSDRALEFETTLDSLTTGDAVLSGRFGPATQLLVPPATRSLAELSIQLAEVTPLHDSRALRISVDITGRDSSRKLADVTFALLNDLPNPMLFVGNELVPMPYDFHELPEKKDDDPPASQNRFVRVEAWISTQMLAKNPSVTFQVPFCGQEYQSSNPLIFSEPTIVRMGEQGNNTIFRIFYPQGLGSSDFNIELDQTYGVGCSNLTKLTDSECRFSVATDLVARFQNIVLRVWGAEPYLLPIPAIAKPQPKLSVDTLTSPARVNLNQHGPVEWSGQALDTITGVAITPPSATSPVAQLFAVYAEGTKLIVYLTAGVTAAEGRLLVDCSTATGDKLSLPLFVVAS